MRTGLRHLINLNKTLQQTPRRSFFFGSRSKSKEEIAPTRKEEATTDNESSLTTEQPVKEAGNIIKNDDAASSVEIYRPEASQEELNPHANWANFPSTKSRLSTSSHKV